MKGLLHSKTFKKNLRKWLFMYVGALCILTSVITYSKYMSSFSGNTEAKVAKFNIKVDYLDKCSNQSSDLACSTDITRPLETYDFYFKVDTTELDVSSFVVITPRIDPTYTDSFKIKDIIEVKENLTTKISSLDKIEYTINPSDSKQVRYYKVTLDHTIKDNDSAGNVNDHTLIVGYSAKQID